MHCARQSRHATSEDSTLLPAGKGDSNRTPILLYSTEKKRKKGKKREQKTVVLKIYFLHRAAEALNGLPRLANDDPGDVRATRLSATSGQRFVSAWTKALELNANIEVETDRAGEEEYDTYLMAKTFFDIKEFDRTAAALKGCSSHKSRFLRLYSRYLASGTLGNRMQRVMALNSYFRDIDLWCSIFAFTVR